ncbi:hypothetical protein EV714DRAFT_269202 [Schizophyllum commune]
MPPSAEDHAPVASTPSPTDCIEDASPADAHAAVVENPDDSNHDVDSESPRGEPDAPLATPQTPYPDAYHLQPEDLFPPGVDLTDTSVTHPYHSRSPTYYLGAIAYPQAIYERLREGDETKEVCLNRFLDDLNKKGITWDCGITKRYIGKEEVWILWVRRTQSLLHALAVSPEQQAGFEDTIRSGAPLRVIIQHYPKVYAKHSDSDSKR